MDLKDFLKNFEEGDYSGTLLILSSSPFLKMYLTGKGYKAANGTSFKNEAGKKLLVLQNLYQLEPFVVGLSLSKVIIDVDIFKSMRGDELLWLSSRVRFDFLENQKIHLMRNPWSTETRDTDKGNFEVYSL